MLLGGTHANATRVNTIADTAATDDDDLSAIETRRSGMVVQAMPNSLRSAYAGAILVRRFLVVHEGVRSSYCL